MIVVIIWPSSESSIGVVRYLSRRPPPHCDGWPSRREMTWWISHLPVLYQRCARDMRLWRHSNANNKQPTENELKSNIYLISGRQCSPAYDGSNQPKSRPTWVRELLLFDIPQPNQSGALLADDGDNGNEWTKTDRQFRFAFVCSTHSRERGESLLLWTDRKAERWTVGTRIHTAQQLSFLL